MQIHRLAIHQASRSTRYGARRRTAAAHDLASREVLDGPGRTGKSNDRDGDLFYLCAGREERESPPFSPYTLATNFILIQKSNAGAPALRQPYLRILGLELDTSTSGAHGGSRSFSPEEEEEFFKLSRSDDLYERFAKSVAPSIFGHLGTFLSTGY